MAQNEKLAVKGFFRLQVVNKDGSVDSDSGWHKNMITNLGFQQYLAFALAANGGSKQVGFVSLGSGAAPAAADTTLASEITTGTKRMSITSATTGTDSKHIRFYGTFGSALIAQQYTLSNIGLFNATTSNATLFAGNTYTPQTWATNQDVNVTYQINFATA